MKDGELRFSNPEKSNAQSISSGWNRERWSIGLLKVWNNGLKTAVYGTSTVVLGTQTVIEINNFIDSYNMSLLYPVGTFNGLLAVEAFYPLFYAGLTLGAFAQTFRSIREDSRRRASNLQKEVPISKETVQQLESTDKLLR